MRAARDLIIKTGTSGGTNRPPACRKQNKCVETKEAGRERERKRWSVYEKSISESERWLLFAVLPSYWPSVPPQAELLP